MLIEQPLLIILVLQIVITIITEVVDTEVAMVVVREHTIVVDLIADMVETATLEPLLDLTEEDTQIVL
jgi:hypothetical protein